MVCMDLRNSNNEKHYVGPCAPRNYAAAFKLYSIESNLIYYLKEMISMSMLDAFNTLNQVRSFEQAADEYHQQPQPAWDLAQTDPNAWLQRHASFTTRPKFNPNMDGYIRPYVGQWGGVSDVMNALQAGMELGPLQEKVEPNKIFTADVAALKTMAADQAKLIKVFERKAMESYNDKGKFGLNEDDIAAMQALTSARSTLMAIQEKQINVKKTIAELKIKQQQAAGAIAPGAQAGPAAKTDVYSVGRSMLDDIFKVPSMTQDSAPVVADNYPTVSLDQAASVLNNIIDEGSVASTTAYESEEPTTYVVIGDDESDREFVTVNKDGDVLDEYPIPSARITELDMSTKTATDEYMVSYPVKTRDELGL